ncbi:hypothetical protein AVEN_246617-1 [Araneus ventricosus]|uniref:Uncharacterized protein n=1 Tax=Araneus ventricosus TaxID=182803 RepID=A0A4Y2DCG7_ARAVE|nr:hypothetical protein AVEN_246617-1 [Araneus ventricosus]
MIRRWPEDAELLTGGIFRPAVVFPKEGKKNEATSGSAGLDLAPKWVHFQRMLFLKDTTIVGHSESNLDGSTLEPMGEL